MQASCVVLMEAMPSCLTAKAGQDVKGISVLQLVQIA